MGHLHLKQKSLNGLLLELCILRLIKDLLGPTSFKNAISYLVSRCHCLHYLFQHAGWEWRGGWTGLVNISFLNWKNSSSFCRISWLHIFFLSFPAKQSQLRFSLEWKMPFFFFNLSQWATNLFDFNVTTWFWQHDGEITCGRNSIMVLIHMAFHMHIFFTKKECFTQVHAARLLNVPR